MSQSHKLTVNLDITAIAKDEFVADLLGEIEKFDYLISKGKLVANRHEKARLQHLITAKAVSTEDLILESFKIGLRGAIEIAVQDVIESFEEDGTVKLKSSPVSVQAKPDVKDAQLVGATVDEYGHYPVGTKVQLNPKSVYAGLGSDQLPLGVVAEVIENWGSSQWTLVKWLTDSGTTKTQVYKTNKNLLLH